MKRLSPNIIDTVAYKFVKEMGFLRKFKRLWGTEIINGVEVFKDRNYYYPSDRFEESTKKLARLLGIYSDLLVKPEGVRSAWLMLNVHKAPDAEVKPTTTTHANNLNIALAGVTSGSVTISSRVIGKRKYEEAPINTSVGDQEGIIQEIQSKFQYLWDNDFTIFGNSTDDYQAAFFMNLLRTTDVEFTIDKVEKIIAPVTYQTSWDVNTIRMDAQPTWRVNFSFSNLAVGDNDDIIRLFNETTSEPPTKMADRQVLQHLTTATSTAGESDDLEYPLYEPTTLSVSDFWVMDVNHNGSARPSTKFYLKTSFIDSKAMSRTDKINYIAQCLDTGYRKKSAKWYEVVLVIVVIVVVTIYSAGTGTAAAAAAWGGAAAAVAATITLAALILSVIAYALGAAGLTRMSGVMGEFLKTVEPLVRVAGIITIVGSFASLWRESTARVAATAAQEGATAAVQSSLTEVALESGKMLIERITGITSLANMQMSHALKMTEFLFGIYQSDQTRQMERMLKNERAELASYQEMDEQSKTSDMLKDFALTYPDILSQDNSVYANLYDRPYEWWSTPYHTGCMQATTVNALWLSKD